MPDTVSVQRALDAAEERFIGVRQQDAHLHSGFYPCVQPPATLVNASPVWKERAKPMVAKVQTTPHQRPDDDREEQVEESGPRAELSCHRTAEVSGEQYRTEDRRAGEGVDRRANECQD